MSIGILGCGPAGMFAAHAAAESGMDFKIYSKTRKSFMRGAQYLHRPIGSLSGSSFQIQYILEGTAEGYRDKVYGPGFSDLRVSPENLVGEHAAWDIREAYDAAWDAYGEAVVPWDANSQDLPSGHDLIISTIPATMLCRNPEHLFEYQLVKSTDFVKPGIVDLYGDDNIVVCSGDPDDWWYRASRIHGWENTEFPDGLESSRYPFKAQLWNVTKPIRNDCDCHPDLVHHGRYGKWQKGVLSHEAYYETLEML